MRILGISGSLRTGSYNSAALDAAEGLLPEGVQLDRFTGLADLPVYTDNSLRNKPVAVIGASTGIFGATWAQAEARKVMKAIGAQVLDAELLIPDAESRFRDGRLDPEIGSQLGELIGALIDAIQAHRPTEDVG